MPTGKPRDLSLVKRVIVAVVFAPVIIWIFLSRGLPLFLFITVLTLVGQWELYGMIGSRLSLSHRALGYCAGLLVPADAYLNGSAFFYGILASVLVLSFCIEIIAGDRDRLEKVALTVLSSVYPASLLAFLLKIEQLPTLLFGAYMRYFFLFILIVIWVFDTASYFTGRAFGRHGFFPKVSPKKTVEGFIGGMIAAAAAGIITGIVIDGMLMGHYVFLSILIALAGQTGDLSESIIKRELGVKDSSGIIPGHGGVLDRFDSLVFAGPVVFVYMLACQWMTGG